MFRPLVCATVAASLGFSALVCIPAPSVPAADPVVDAVPGERPDGQPALPRVEIAILLDTSGSMDGLIDQARAKLWAIVNDLAATTKDGRIPELRVALYEYGNDGLSQTEHFIRQVLPLSDDLDAVSEALFALRTNGGEEYCGAVIGRAVEHLAWSDGDHYRAIFIAGNEPFTQGPVPYTTSCKTAASRGIVVNTIHCGELTAAGSGMWQHGAQLADGESLNIDHNQVELAIAAPQDDRIQALNRDLNATYLAYGAAGRERAARQEAQDANAAQLSSSSFGSRAVAKASGHYKNTDWDLVDAVAEGEVQLEELSETQLPAAMQDMDAEQRAAHVAEQAQKRQALQAELREQVAAREAHVAAERAKAGDRDDDGFGSAVRSMLKEQLAERGYTPAE